MIPGEILDVCWFSFMKFDNIPRRDHESTVTAMKTLANSDEPVNFEGGIKNVSALINFPYFDIINGFSVDYFHGGLSGVGT